MRPHKSMIRTWYSIGLLSLMCSTIVYADELKDDFSQITKAQALEQAFMSKDLDAAAAFVDEISATEPEQSVVLATMLYRLSAVMMNHSEKYEDRILTQLAKAEALLDKVISEHANPERSGAAISSNQAPNILAQANALMSGVIGLRIGISPWKGIFLGSKSSSYLELAMMAAPNDHLVIWMSAIRYHRTPASFGGDIEKARAQYAKLAFSTDAERGGYDWLRKDALRSYCLLAKRGEVPEACVLAENAQRVN